jgi:hypothetical protein
MELPLTGYNLRRQGYIQLSCLNKNFEKNAPKLQHTVGISRLSDNQPWNTAPTTIAAVFASLAQSC